jgi:hypothetical protein
VFGEIGQHVLDQVVRNGGAGGDADTLDALEPRGIDLGDVALVMPGDSVQVTVRLGKDIAMDVGLGFAVREGGRTVAAGTVTELLD